MLLPRPTSYAPAAGHFTLSEHTVLAAAPELEGVAQWLRAALGPAIGFALHQGDREADVVRLAIDRALPAEGYRVTVTPEAVQIDGGGAAGVFYGAQTLRQLLPPQVFRRAHVTGVAWTAPACQIEDAPRFGWRGAMLDVVRHFVPKADVLRLIDLLAMHRLNVLHLHLTDDQGWRVEIKRYPRLTEVGAWRRESQIGAAADAPGDGRPHGGFYTQDDLREIVAYAAERHVTVVPEIETPGHAQAAIAAYPELGVTGEQLDVWTRWGINDNVLNVEESTIDFFRHVLDEVMEIFPSTFIGIGGDECPKTQWESSPRVQERMRELGVADGEALQSWFVRRLDAHLTARGRRLFGWDEILEGGLAPGATVASWRGMYGAVAAARKGHDVVACPDDLVYLDYRQSELPTEPIPVSIPLTLQDVYGFDPVPAELSADEAAHILGGQCNIWTEHMDSPRVIDYMAFPRLCAFAEAIWSSGQGNFAEFHTRLDQHLRRLDAIGVEYRRDTGPLPWQERPGIVGRPATRDERAAYFAEVTQNILD